MNLTSKKSVLVILAIFCMFLPRRFEILNIYSYRIFLLIAVFAAFVIFGCRVKTGELLSRPIFIIYIVYFCLRYMAAGEIVSMIGFFVDTVVLLLLFTSLISSKKNLDFWVDLFLHVLLIYCILCIIETCTGFTVWSLFGASSSAQRYGLNRSYGAFTTSINNGVFLMLCFPLIYYRKTYIKKDAWNTAMQVLLWGALICTLSRGPILAALLLHIIWLWENGIFNFLRKYAPQIILCVGLVIVLYTLTPLKSVIGNFMDMFVAIFDSDVAENISDSFGSNAEGVGHRFSLYTWVWDSIQKEHAIVFGVGPFKAFNYAFVTNQGSTHIKQSIENFYLSQFYRFGIVGLVILILFFVGSLVRVSKRISSEMKRMNLRHVSETFQFRLASTIFCYYVVLFTVSAADDYRMFFILLVLSELWDKILRMQKNETVEIVRRRNV